MLLTDSTAGSSGGSVQQMPEALAVKPYPNPTNNILHLDIQLTKQRKLQVVVIDDMGKTVYRSDSRQFSTGTTTVPVNIKNLTPGVYFYNIQDEQGTTYCHGRLSKL